MRHSPYRSAGRESPLTLDNIEVIAPHLKRRLSGVTATIARLLPVQARSIGIVATGSGLPADVPFVPLWSVILMSGRKGRVWHARRNTEMLLGLFLRHVLRKRLKLVFTSASQRHHTRYTRLLISGMDAVLATSGRTASRLGSLSDAVAATLAESRRGAVLRNGVRLVIAGAPNVGKSSLLNRLARADTAISGSRRARAAWRYWPCGAAAARRPSRCRPTRGPSTSRAGRCR